MPHSVTMVLVTQILMLYQIKVKLREIQILKKILPFFQKKKIAKKLYELAVLQSKVSMCPLRRYSISGIMIISHI